MCSKSNIVIHYVWICVISPSRRYVIKEQISVPTICVINNCDHREYYFPLWTVKGLLKHRYSCFFVYVCVFVQGSVSTVKSSRQFRNWLKRWVVMYVKTMPLCTCSPNYLLVNKIGQRLYCGIEWFHKLNLTCHNKGNVATWFFMKHLSSFLSKIGKNKQKKNQLAGSKFFSVRINYCMRIEVKDWFWIAVWMKETLWRCCIGEIWLNWVYDILWI